MSTRFTTNSETTTQAISTLTCQGSDDPDCNSTQYIIILVSCLGLIFMLTCGWRCLLCLINWEDSFGCRDCWKWRQSETSTDVDIFYPREDRQNRGNQNLGFVDPPPRYDQIFKRGGGTPTVITTRQPPASVSSSVAETIEPPSYEHFATNRSYTTTSSIYPLSVQTMAIDMEHPSMPSPTETIDDIENAMADIQNHAHACVQRYDSAHAAQVIASTTSDAEISSPPTEGGPPCYDTISIRNEIV